MTVHNSTINAYSPTRDRIAKGIMILAAAAAFYAMIASIGTAISAGPDTMQVEWWRAFGFMLFTSLFLMLAFWPRRYPGLWEVIILNKAALTIAEILLIQRNAADAFSTAVADGILVLFLIAAYLLSRGYESWRRTT